MKNLRQRITKFGLAVSIAATSLAASITPALAARYGIDFDRYCKSQYQRNGMVAWTQLNGNTAYNWSCAQRQPNGRVQQFSINVGHACAVQQNTWRHGFTNFNNPYSWYCER
jgi:hypothetical protein